MLNIQDSGSGLREFGDFCRPEKPEVKGSVEEGSSPRGEVRQRKKSCTKHALEKEMRRALEKDGGGRREALDKEPGGRREVTAEVGSPRPRESCSAGSRRSSHSSHGRKLSR